MIDGLSGIKNIVDKQDAVSMTKVFRRISPPVHHNPVSLTNIRIGPRDNGGIEYRMGIPTYNLEKLADNIGKIRPAPEGNINDVGHKAVVINLVGHLERVVADSFVG